MTAKTMWTGRRAERSGKQFLSEKRARKEQELLRAVQEGLASDATVLDLGAGNGFLSLTTAAYLDRGRVIAVDLSGDMLAQLREQAGVERVHRGRVLGPAGQVAQLAGVLRQVVELPLGGVPRVR